MSIQDRIYASTGFGPIDHEHGALSIALQDLVHRVNSGRAEDVRLALEAVMRGVADHFSHEERLMTLHGYAPLAKHAQAHETFLADLRKFHRELLAAGLTPNFRRWAVGRLSEWFRYHILAYDMGLGQFLLKKVE